MILTRSRGATTVLETAAEMPPAMKSSIKSFDMITISFPAKQNIISEKKNSNRQSADVEFSFPSETQVLLFIIT